MKEGELTETVFTWGAPPIKFGTGAIDEIGYDLGRYDVERVLVVTDPGVAGTGVPQRIRRTLEESGLKAEIYDGVRVEPTDESFREAVEWAGGTDWDAFVAVGGGSSIDTAKAVDLLTTFPGELMDYVNAPIGEGKAPPGPVKPLIAVPTTAGTGAESTAVCVLDILHLEVKTGISHWRLQPTMAVIDPLVTLSMPPMVTASVGMDVVCHALEAYTARPFHAYPRKQAEERVAYCGANPISDLWSERALELVSRSLRTAVMSGHDLQARTDMLMAATFAGLGFGNAGVHIPHSCAYPIGGMVRDYSPPDYPDDHAMVPHGMAVSLTAPAALRFTYPSGPERHLRAAKLLAPDDAVPRSGEDRREALPRALADLMRDIGMPNGIAAVGYDQDDLPALVEGTMAQERLLVLSPRPVADEDVERILRDSFEIW